MVYAPIFTKWKNDWCSVRSHLKIVRKVGRSGLWAVRRGVIFVTPETGVQFRSSIWAGSQSGPTHKDQTMDNDVIGWVLMKARVEMK